MQRIRENSNLRLLLPLLLLCVIERRVLATFDRVSYLPLHLAKVFALSPAAVQVQGGFNRQQEPLPLPAPQCSPPPTPILPVAEE